MPEAYPLPSSGPISFKDLRGEHHVTSSGSISLANLYRGSLKGPINSGTNSSIPTTGQISMDDFYGTCGVQIITSSGPSSRANWYLRNYSSSMGMSVPPLYEANGYSYQNKMSIDKTKNIVFRSTGSAPYARTYTIGNGTYGITDDRSNLYGYTILSYKVPATGNLLSEDSYSEGHFTYNSTSGNSETLITCETDNTNDSFASKFHVHALNWSYSSAKGRDVYTGFGSLQTVSLSGSFNTNSTKFSNQTINEPRNVYFGISEPTSTSLSQTIWAFGINSSGVISSVYSTFPVPGFPAENSRFGYNMAVHPSNNAVGYCGRRGAGSGDSPFIEMRTWSNSSGFGSAYSSFSFTSNSHSPTAMAFSNNGDAVVVSTGDLGSFPYQFTGFYQYAWNSSSGFGSRYTNISSVTSGSTDLSGYIENITFSQNDDYLIASSTFRNYNSFTGHRSMLYKWSSGSGITQKESFGYSSYLSTYDSVFA